MTVGSKHIMYFESRKQFPTSRWCIVLCLALLFLLPGSLFAQVISNTGSVVNISSAVVVAKDFEISSGDLKNDGVVNLSGNFLNTGTTFGDGTFRIGG